MQNRHNRSFPLWAVVFLLPAVLFILHITTFSTPGYAQRNPAWAQSVAARDVHNFYLIDEGIYRSGQPSPAGFAELEAMGIGEVLNLRSQNNDNREAQGTSLVLHHIRMNSATPDTEKLVDALRIIRNRRAPILIHCWHGSDRTGLVSALYRIVYQGWTREAAIEELHYGGYGYHPIYKKIITYLEEFDPDALRRMVEEQ